jgi:hypothetical protein
MTNTTITITTASITSTIITTRIPADPHGRVLRVGTQEELAREAGLCRELVTHQR